MPFNYSSLSACIARVVDLTDNDGEEKESEIEIKLSDSAATKDLLIHYRPLLVAALIEEQNYTTQTLTAANDGIKFSGNLSQIKSWIREQIAQDTQLVKNGFEIPPGYDAASAYREVLLRMGIDPDDATGPIMSVIVA